MPKNLGERAASGERTLFAAASDARDRGAADEPPSGRARAGRCETLVNARHREQRHDTYGRAVVALSPDPRHEPKDAAETHRICARRRRIWASRLSWTLVSQGGIGPEDARGDAGRGADELAELLATVVNKAK